MGAVFLNHRENVGPLGDLESVTLVPALGDLESVALVLALEDLESVTLVPALVVGPLGDLESATLVPALEDLEGARSLPLHRGSLCPRYGMLQNATKLTRSTCGS